MTPNEDHGATTATPVERSPQDFRLPLLTGFWLSRAVWLAARLRLADVVGSGPTSAEEIARATETDPDSTARLMRALSAAGLFRADEEGRYGPTPSSDLLRSDHPSSQRALLEMLLGGESFEAWGAIEDTLRTGRTAFESRHGMNWIDYYAAHPEAGRAFAEAMSDTTRAFEAAILDSDPFPEFGVAVDVGGSQGSLLRGLLERNTEARGVVLDLPEVIAGGLVGADDLGGRLTGVAGNFFESVPEGGDLYLLKLILHDWDDERAETILRRVRDAVRSGGSVAIVETMLPDSPVDHPAWLLDLNMLVMTGGRERTKAEFGELLDRTGWRFDRVVPTESPQSVLIASAD
jgi:O-methyltransferase domain/Dimerisation domain